MYDLEEPPPPHRAKPVKAESAIARRPLVTLVVAIVALAFVATMAAAQVRLSRRIARLERELAQAVTGLAEARGSLSLLWTTATKLDASQAQRADSLQVSLQDSIASVQTYAENEFSRLWETAYLDHERRLEETASRLRINGEAISDIVTAAGRTNARIDGLVRQEQIQEVAITDVTESMTSLRQTLSAIDGQLSILEGETSVSRNAQRQLDTRIDGVEEWVNAFRDEGLSAGSVQSRLATLFEDLRTVAMRVDSLRTARDTARRGIGQH
ncbi:MAG: hypothetical protein ACREL7_05175 [Longimicrobiales bacterium]